MHLSVLERGRHGPLSGRWRLGTERDDETHSALGPHTWFLRFLEFSTLNVDRLGTGREVKGSMTKDNVPSAARNPRVPPSVTVTHTPALLPRGGCSTN